MSSNNNVLHYVFISIMAVEVVAIIFSESTRTNWIVFLLFTGMIYAIIGSIVNQRQLSKYKSLKEETKEETKKDN